MDIYHKGPKKLYHLTITLWLNVNDGMCERFKYISDFSTFMSAEYPGIDIEKVSKIFNSYTEEINNWILHNPTLFNPKYEYLDVHCGLSDSNEFFVSTRKYSLFDKIMRSNKQYSRIQNDFICKIECSSVLIKNEGKMIEFFLDSNNRINFNILCFKNCYIVKHIADDVVQKDEIRCIYDGSDYTVYKSVEIKK